MAKSMITVAYDILNKKVGKNKGKAVLFNTLWAQVCEELQFSKEEQNRKVSQFFMDLSLDDRFVNVDNKGLWDLKSRHTFAETVVNTEAILVNDEEDEEANHIEVEDINENKEDY